MENMRKVLPLIYIILAFASSSMANDNQALMDRLDRMQTDLNILQKQVYGGQPKTVHEIIDSSNNAPKLQAPTNTTSSNLEVRLLAYDEKLRQLTGNLEELEFKVKRISDKLDKLTADIEFRLKELETKTGNNAQATDKKLDAVNHELPVTNKPEAVIEPDLKDQISHSINLIKESKLDEAALKLNKVIDSPKQDILKGEAFYWLGEAYYLKKDYNKSALNFLKSYKDYPDGAKAAESIIRLASSLSKINKMEEACQSLVKLTSGKIKAEQALKQRAIDEATKLKCNI